jgi:hypothetical protein
MARPSPLAITLFVARRGSLLACAAVLVLAGCATPAPEPPPVAAPAPAAPAPVCPTCDEQVREVARLRQELAARDAELRDLRAAQREQAKAVQETTREVTRAKTKARRLATQADAASYLAEVEVALSTLRAGKPMAGPLPALAASFLDAAAGPFARGDYAAAMERAAQAEQVVALAAEGAAPTGARPRRPGEVPLQVALPLRATTDMHLRRQPRGGAAVLGVVKRDAPLVAQAYLRGWMRVETADGRRGWVADAQLASR